MANNITSILDRKNNAKKLDLIIAIVKDARKKYNNRDSVIDSPVVPTTCGVQGIKYLSVSDKAAVATKEIRAILRDLNSLDATTQGVNIKRELTSAIATNPVLVNLEASLDLGLE